MLPTGDVPISINGPEPGHSGTTDVKPATPPKNPDELQRYLERRVIVLCAGRGLNRAAPWR